MKTKGASPVPSFSEHSWLDIRRFEAADTPEKGSQERTHDDEENEGQDDEEEEPKTDERRKKR